MSRLAIVAGAIARQAVRALVRIYYPNIQVVHPELIPAQGPVLLTPNHPNALMDPPIVGTAARRPVHFLAKAPLFEVPVFGGVLRALGMVPAYRKLDDPSQLTRNVDSLARAAAHLVRGEAVAIFPEGKSHDLPKVEQVRTGAARIAVQAIQQGAHELKIVPVGINYEEKDRIFSAVWVQIGEPIDVAIWLKDHTEDERRTVRALTQEIDRRLKDIVIHLDEEGWEPFLNDLEALRSVPKSARSEPIPAALRQRKRTADAINFFLAQDRLRAEAVASRIQGHRADLASMGLTMRSSVVRWRGPLLLVRMKWEAARLLLGLVPALAGTAHHVVPFFLTRALARPFQMPGRFTTALARLLVGLPIYAAWYGLAGWCLAAKFGLMVTGIWLGLMPFAGAHALYYWPRIREHACAWWQQCRLLFRPAELRRLRQNQLELRRRLSELAEEFACGRAHTQDE